LQILNFKKEIKMKKIILALGLAALMVGCTTSHPQVETHPANAEALKAAHAKKAHGGKHDENDIHWGYETYYGPSNWDKFSLTCGEGHAQSPINIIPGKTVSMNHTYDLELHEDIHTTAMVIDNGHSIKVTPKKGGTLDLNGETFTLLQFHFHGKSEHTVDGKRYALVVHMVHQNLKTKQLAVVAVFFEEGKENPILDSVIYNIGSEIAIDPQDLLPKDTAHYYHYVGSLTTPPCSENVQWYILKQPQTASKEQIDELRSFYIGNERPVQEVYDRHIESN
jgi:carbonic anhydrase